MKRTFILCAVLIPNLFWAAASKPKTSENKTEYSTTQKLQLSEALKDANRVDNGINTDLVFHCGFTVPITVEPEVYFSRLPNNENGIAYCSYARLGLAEVCEDGSDEAKATFKKLIKEKIKSIHCAADKDPKAIHVTLKNGVLNMALGPKMNDNGIKDAVYDFVKKTF